MKLTESKVNLIVPIWPGRSAVAAMLAGALCLVTQGTALAQVSQSETILTKGLMFSQTSSAAPVQASQNAAIFEASLPGLDGPSGPLAPSASITLPSGSIVSVPYDSSDMAFLFAATNNTPAGLSATYPPGHYTLSVTAKYISAANPAVLPADNFPPAPQFNNYAAAQQIDPTQDFDLLFGAFAGAASPDDSTIEIYDSSGSIILSDTPDLGGTSYTISQNTLSSGQTYTVHLRFRSLVVTPESTFSSAVGFYSETVMNIATQGSSTGNLPPTLTNSIPSAGQSIVSTDPLLLQFDQAMNQNDISIQWTETINGASVPLAANTFTYIWTDSQTLACFYGALGGTWPGGALFSWTLNPASDASSNFSSTAGVALATDTYSGSFITPGGPWNCAAQANDPIEAPAFYLIKASNYVQAGQSAPAPDPNLGAQFQASFEMPDNGALTSPPLIAVALPPSGLPYPEGLVLTEAETPADLLADRLDYMYTGSASGSGGLDAAYPAGNYVLEMAAAGSASSGSPPVPTNSVSLSVASGAYPPVPQLTNSTVLPLDTLANGLTVAWLPWAGAGANSYISFQVLDPSNNVVFSAPNSCGNLPLPSTASSIAIPANLLSNGVSYQIVLSFLSLSDSSEYMPNIPGAGYAALASVTRMGMFAYMSPPPTIAITAPAAGAFLPSGAVTVQVTAAQPDGFLATLQLFSGTTAIGTLSLGPGVTNFSGTISGSIPPGPQTLSVTATDNNGQTATAGPVPIMAQSPNFLVTVTSPANGAAFPPFATIPLTASASSPNGAITNVNFFMDGSLLASVTSPPFSVPVPQVSPGSHQFFVQAQDAMGFGGESATVSVTVEAIAARRMAAFFSTNGTLSFGFSGSAASGYILESAASLAPPVDWVPIQTKLLSSAQGIFSDPDYNQFANRYYRIAPLTASITNAPAFSVPGLTDPNLAASMTYQLELGASAAVTNRNGAVFNFTLFPAALPLDEPVTMTLGSGIQDYPFAGPLIGAVELAPSEVDLFVEATLVIQLPPNVSTNQVAAFTYHLPNGQIFLTPFSITNVVVGSVTNPAIVIPINRMGGYGIAALTAADLNLASEYPPTDPADSLDQATSLFVLAANGNAVARPAKGGGAGGPSGPPTDEEEVQLLLDQFDVIYAQMQADEASGNVNPCDIAAWGRWLNAAEIFQSHSLIQDQFSIQLTEFAQALANIYQVAITKLILEADSQHDWNTLIKLLNLDLSGKLNASVVAPGWQPGQQEALQSALDACLNFEFDFDTSIENDSTIGTETSHLTAQVTFAEGNPSSKGQVKGQAAVQWEETDFPSIPKCSSVTASPSTPNFLMFAAVPAGPAPTPNDNCGGSSTYTVTGLRSVFWPGNPMENFSTTCEGYSVPLPNFWMPEFGILYQSDLYGYPPKGGTPAASFNVEDNWQIEGGGGNPVLATRQGSASQSYQGATFTETSTWTLKHTPQ